jgi:hypothetical protein
MPHAKSLRAIGQSLEALGIVAFVMEKDGRNYLVRSDELPDLAELDHRKSLSEKVWDPPSVARKSARLRREDGALSYDPSYVSWLDAQGRKKRRKRLSAQATGTARISQLLRTLGRHIDRYEPHAFTISWKRDSVCVDYDLADGQTVREILSIDKLRELTVRSRVRRSRRR